MRMSGNCLASGFRCPFLEYPRVHSGYTGKSGPDTWFYCGKTNEPIRRISKCALAGDANAQREAFGAPAGAEE